MDWFDFRWPRLSVAKLWSNMSFCSTEKKLNQISLFALRAISVLQFTCFLHWEYLPFHVWLRSAHCRPSWSKSMIHLPINSWSIGMLTSISKIICQFSLWTFGRVSRTWKFRWQPLRQSSLISVHHISSWMVSNSWCVVYSCHFFQLIPDKGRSLPSLSSLSSTKRLLLVPKLKVSAF